MSIVELFLIGVGLSMDAFAVAVCQGLCMPKLNLRQGGVIALYFGGFQALMPLIGWFLGSQFAGYIQSFDHWVAFALLVLIGGNMARGQSTHIRRSQWRTGTPGTRQECAPRLLRRRG